jgi:hypothetical protein
MAGDLEARHVEVTGRALALWAACPVRDNGVDLLVFAADYGWPQPVQVKAHPDRDTTVYQGYTRGGLGRLPLQPGGDLRAAAGRPARRLADS